MFNRRISAEECEVDILRAPVNRSRNYSLVMLVCGHGQVGKTTFIWYLANRIMQLRKGYMSPTDPRCTWKEWDAYNLTAMDARDFVRLWNNNHDAVLTLAESSTTLYYMDWFNIMSRVFNSTTTTQGLKHNICFLDTVMATELMQKARDKVDYRIDVHRRIDFLRMAKVRSGFVLIDYLRDRWKLIPYNEWHLTYSKSQLALAKKYTDWIASSMKQNEAEENERRVGLRPTENDIKIAKEAQETQKWMEEQQKHPIKVEDFIH
jgi:hypothetical protein